PASIEQRIAAYEWPRVVNDLDAGGCAVLPALLAAHECAALAGGYGDDARYRSRVVMARHGFGRGEYRYYAYPLPALVQQLRETVYPRLVPVANRWNEVLRTGIAYPATHAAYVEGCHAAGQQRPTPLILRYAAGDYNCLHQDLYGAHWFP